MPQLASFRSGWENENLARFILSRFSFIANPSTISDDIGSDFYCTLFQRIKKGDHAFLQPKNTFVIQIKSNTSNIDVTKHWRYFVNLELPYLVGVVSRTKMNLVMYSGEILPEFISIERPSKIEIKLCERQEYGNGYFEKKGSSGQYVLNFPKIAEIDAAIDTERLAETVDELAELCSFIHLNMSSRASHEYIFANYGGDRLRIVAGSSSNKTFRDNFCKRLAEVFYNLEWIYTKQSGKFELNEFRIFQELYESLSKHYQPLPGYLVQSYVHLSKLLGI